MKPFLNLTQNPHIIEERLNNVTQLDIFSRLLLDRIIYLGDAIDLELANIITGQLLYLDHDNNKTPINMYINSPGGDVYAGNSILDVIDLIKAPVYTTCIGFAASMGAVILSNGEKGHRNALKRSRIMIHQPSSGGIGQITELEIMLKEANIVKDEIYRTLSTNTNKSIDYIKDACDRDTWMSAQESIDFGLIDNIIN